MKKRWKIASFLQNFGQKSEKVSRESARILKLERCKSLLFAVCSRLRMQPHRTNSNNSLLQWSVTVHLSSCGVCLGDSGVSVPHFVAAFSSVFGGIFRVVVSRFCSTWDSKGAKDCKSCSSRKMLKNAYLDAKIGFDAEENEPSKVWWFGWKIGVKFGIESFN